MGLFTAELSRAGAHGLHEMLHFVGSPGHVYPWERLGLPTSGFRESSVLASPSLVLTPVVSG